MARRITSQQLSEKLLLAVAGTTVLPLVLLMLRGTITRQVLRPLKPRAREGQVRELQVGRESMAHVLENIGQQQREAHERPTLEPCDAVELVARNATIARYRNGGSITFSYPAAPCPVLANRVILSQVIGNLFSNAAEAITASGAATGQISVEVDHGDVVEVMIRDTGEGSDPEVQRTLLQRGIMHPRAQVGVE